MKKNIIKTIDFIVFIRIFAKHTTIIKKLIQNLELALVVWGFFGISVFLHTIIKKNAKQKFL